MKQLLADLGRRIVYGFGFGFGMSLPYHFIKKWQEQNLIEKRKM